MPEHCERCCPTHRERAHERLIEVALSSGVATVVVLLLKAIGI